MARLSGIALLLAMTIPLFACGSYEEQKQKVVRVVSAAVFERFVSVQRCATLTQGSVKSPAPANRARPAVTVPVAPPASSCRLSAKALAGASRKTVVAAVKAVDSAVCGS